METEQVKVEVKYPSFIIETDKECGKHKIKLIKNKTYNSMIGCPVCIDEKNQLKWDKIQESRTEQFIKSQENNE